jgi:tRNA (mo5U34)-methyltransferase
LCLETLVVEGGPGHVLVPTERYARMKNVWFLPSASELQKWLQRCGFVDIRIVDINKTTSEEQRSTDWMQFESLSDSLDPKDTAFTQEGLPAPRRAILMATKP